MLFVYIVYQLMGFIIRWCLDTDDIQIRFYEQSPEGECVWEAYPDVNNLDVHHQVINMELV